MDKIEQILSKMTLEDKIALCSGDNFWETKGFEKYDIPSFSLSDGPSGLRKQNPGTGTDMIGVNESLPATCFPAADATACSWDVTLTEKIGSAIGEEALEQGVAVALGPAMNIKRNPLCGRNFEYFSEDPYLAGKMAAGFIKGVEGQGVASSLKHFAGNSQELNRFNSDSVIDERTLREIYLSGFEIAVKEGKPSTVMCAYNKINGVHCSDSKELLTDILRDEWGFDGIVVTDWGAMSDRIEGFKAGCDLNMPGGSAYMEKECLDGVKNGTLSEKDIDKCAGRIIALALKSAEHKSVKHECDYSSHNTLAGELAQQCAVLLKNEDHILPLKEDGKVGLFGYMAKEMRYQGAGSSHTNPTQITNPIDVMPDLPFALGCEKDGSTDDALISEAVELAKSVDTPVIFAGLPDNYESEGFDRENMQMPEGHIRLINAIAGANENTVVVLMCGCAVECPWADKVKGILFMGLSGQAGGSAVKNLLYGKANPCGKLAETWPIKYADVPSSSYYGKEKDALYLESIYEGYRYYDKANVPVRWPFGYGLSYTSFRYSDLNAKGSNISVTVKNTGDMAGSEVVQLYILLPQDGLHRPVKELKGFEKVFLQPGESKEVEFTLDDRAFSLWKDGWVKVGGEYTVQVGNLSAVLHVEGESVPAPDWQKGSWYENCNGTPSHHEFEKILGRQYSPEKLTKGKFTMDNTVMEMKDYSLIMKIMFKAIEGVVSKSFGGKKDYSDPTFRMILSSSAGSPLRSMQISGGMKGGVMQGMLEMANGHFFKGIGKMIKG